MSYRKREPGRRVQVAYRTVLMLLAVASVAIIPTLSTQASADEAEDSAPSQSTSASTRSAADGVADAEGDAEYVGEMYRIGLGWHPAALEKLPTDKFGLVDWVAALDQGLISPRGSIEPGGPEGMPFDMNIVMPSKTGMIAGAYFPHKTHTTWMSCDSCHTKIFMPLAGSNDLTMSTITSGQACGVCHGKVAFPLNDCKRCHVSTADPGDGKAAQQ